MTRSDDDLCLECELGHPCQVHDRTPPPPSTASRRGWLRRLVGRPRFPRPTRPDAPTHVAGQGDAPARPPTRGGRVPPGSPPPPPRTKARPPDPPPPPRGGYPSSRRPASDLGRPPSGPAPGGAA